MNFLKLKKEGIRKIAKKCDINFETSALPKSKRLKCKFILRLKLKDIMIVKYNGGKYYADFWNICRRKLNTG